MEGADGGDVQSGGLFQQGLNLGTVLAHDADVVPPCLAGPVLLHIQCAELAEAVGGEQHLVVGIIGHNDLRPVDHGSGNKGQGVLAQGQGGAFAHHDSTVSVVIAEELLHHVEGLGGGHHCCVGVDLQKIGDVGGMVRLHMLYHQVVRLTAGQRVLNIVQPLVGEIAVHRVHNGDLLVQNDVGVVSHAARHHILALEQVYLMIVDTHIADILGNGHSHFSFIY